MRIPRKWIKNSKADQYFHIISRVVDKRFALCDASKGTLEFFLKQHERFSGCEIGAHCVMDNHFHLLIKVPARPEQISEEEVLYRMGGLVSPERMAKLRTCVEEYHRSGNVEAIGELLKPYINRMYDMSQFMKDFKQRFTQWYNYQNGREGTLWESRYKSVLLESGAAVRRVAQYIDLNPVRAGIVASVEGYAWCSYGRIMMGDQHCQWRFFNFFSPDSANADRDPFKRPEAGRLSFDSDLRETLLRYEEDLRMHNFGHEGGSREEKGMESHGPLDPLNSGVGDAVGENVEQVEELGKGRGPEANSLLQAEKGVEGGKDKGEERNFCGDMAADGGQSHIMDRMRAIPKGCMQLTGPDHLDYALKRHPEISESKAFGSPEFIKDFYQKIPESFVSKKFF
ncbi:MAG: hypothetical protein LR011_01315 [Verrucomicrobia bacterium]|nr:hypothetical protein [Verrucomicrobiota bacterium]